MPASGFLISWASISAMPIADFAAVFNRMGPAEPVGDLRGSKMSQQEPRHPHHRRDLEVAEHRACEPVPTSTSEIDSEPSRETHPLERLFEIGVDGENVEHRGVPEASGGDVEKSLAGGVDLGDKVGAGSTRKAGTGSEAQSRSENASSRGSCGLRVGREKRGAGDPAPFQAARSGPPGATRPRRPPPPRYQPRCLRMTRAPRSRP